MLKKIFLFLLVTFVVTVADDDYEIKTLRIYQTGNEISFPIALLGSKVTIEFDIKSEAEPTWEILFLFCDKEWQPYDNLSLIDEQSNTERNLWFETLNISESRATFHYKGSFPNNNVKFPRSGKWMFFIRDTYDTDMVYGEGKFYVVNKTIVKLETAISQKSMQGRDIVPAVFGEVNNIKVSVTLTDSLFLDKVENIEVIENKKMEDPIVINKTYDDEFRYYETDNVNSYYFFAKNIQPGSAYRQVNLMSVTKYSAPKTSAHFEGVEVSNKFHPSKRDNFGGSKLMNYEKPYAEYMDVEFKLSLPDGYYKNVYLVGAFTDWDVYPEFRMKEKDGLFTTTAELKRGIYDYQYVVVEFKNNYLSNIDWIELEGNSWATKRKYNVFLFYQSDEDGGYDEIIGYNRIWSGD